MSENNLQKEFAELDELLSQIDLNNVSSDYVAKELKDGAYLCELKKAELVLSKKSNKLQAKLTFKTVEDGLTDDEDGNLLKIEKTKGINIYKYYSLADISKIEIFASDMLKFEAEPGKPLLPKEALKRADTINESLELLEDMRIYVQVSNTYDENTGSITNTWYNLLSWKRASLLGLPID